MKKNKKKRKNKPRPKRPLPLKWDFEPGIPTDDFFEEHDPRDGYSEAVENFIFIMEKDEFLAWEAVMAHEQGLRLTRQQRAALDGLINFGDPEDDEFFDDDYEQEHSLCRVKTRNDGSGWLHWEPNVRSRRPKAKPGCRRSS